MITLSACDRYALVGKTRSGKTYAATTLCALFGTAMEGSRWRTVWLDTKGDPRDHRRLERLGFKRTDPRKLNRADQSLLYVALEPIKGLPVRWQAQRIVEWAKRRRNVVLVVDEYTQVVENTVSEGEALKDVFTRGGGLQVGIVGETQEPVYVPRRLLSQATHCFLFRVTYPADIKRLREICPEYMIPDRDEHGFWYSWLDGTALSSKWRYFSDIKEFLAQTGLKEG